MKNLFSSKVSRTFLITIGLLLLFFCVWEIKWIVNATRFYYSVPSIYFFNKKLTVIYKVKKISARVYIESHGNSEVELLNYDRILAIIKNIQYNFPEYMAKYHPDVKLPPLENNDVSLFFIKENTYNLFDKMESTRSDAFYSKYIKCAFFPASAMKYDVLINEETIIHELFHHLIGLYGIKLENEEKDATRFEHFKR